MLLWREKECVVCKLNLGWANSAHGRGKHLHQGLNRTNTSLHRLPGTHVPSLFSQSLFTHTIMVLVHPDGIVLRQLQGTGIFQQRGRRSEVVLCTLDGCRHKTPSHTHTQPTSPTRYSAKNTANVHDCPPQRVRFVLLAFCLLSEAFSRRSSRITACVQSRVMGCPCTRV